MEMIACIAKTSAGSFTPFIEQTYNVLLSMHDDSLSDDYLDEVDSDLFIIDTTDVTLSAFTSLYGNK